MELNTETIKRLAIFQRNEINGHHIYKRIAGRLQDAENRAVIEKLSADEIGHYQTWKRYTHQDIKPDWMLIWFYVLISRLFGFTFGIKLMEIAEEQAQVAYGEIMDEIPEAAAILADEEEHEEKLLGMLDEQGLRYVGSIVLGMNDALVELTGVLAGLTLAFQNTQLIALSGLITGISASVSMAASEYLSTRTEGSGERHPVRAAIYTGIAYILTVALLISPYLLLENYYVCLAISLALGVIIIAVFNYYLSVAKGEHFRTRFLEMAGLSLGVAAFSFLVGFLIRQWLGVEL
jgi:VIT1/CCC1 family predicted Fe2+/Mn2+ transporter